MRVNRQPAADAGRATRRATDDRIPGELHDFIGIGLGPFNLGLACLAEPIAGLRGLFLERRAGFDWHPGMLIDDTTLQNPFLADLVSLADPKNRFSFLNYCKQEGKLHAFFIRERFYLGRAEFNRYCQWAAAQLDNIVFDADVEHITHDEATGLYTVAGRHPRTLAPFAHRAPKLVIGVGSSPSLPKCCEPSREHCIHSAHYLDKKAYLQSKRSIAVIGSGQSAAEIFLDLLEDSDTFGYRLTWITRSPRFLPMETTKLTLELTSPDYLDYLNSLSDETRERILSRQDALYKGINATLINRIYDRLDERRHDGRRNVVLATNAELVDCRYDESASRYHLQFIQRDEGLRYTHLSDAAIFATGHAHPVAPLHRRHPRADRLRCGGSLPGLAQPRDRRRRRDDLRA